MKQFKSMTKQLYFTSLICGVLTLNGCAVGGSDEFACPNPEKGVCTDSYTAMQLANNGKTAKNYAPNTHINHQGSTNEDGDQQGHSHSEDENHQIENEGESTPYRDVAPVAGLMQRPIDQPRPVLLPATVLEMWFDSYEDANGILRMPQTAFAEVSPRRWSLTNTKVEQFKSAGPFSRSAQVE